MPKRYYQKTLTITLSVQRRRPLNSERLFGSKFLVRSGSFAGSSRPLQTLSPTAAHLNVINP